MAADHVGYLDFSGKVYRFHSARCTFRNHQLDVEADGRKCRLKLYGIPFPGVESVAELRGKSFGPDSETVASDPIAEGGIDIGEGAHLAWQSLEVRCKSYHPEANTFSVSFQGDVEDLESGKNGTVDGSVVCMVRDKLW